MDVLHDGAGTFITTGVPGNEGTQASKLALNSVGSNIQLYQTPLNNSLEPNTGYRLSFMAYSNTGHDVTVKLFKHTNGAILYAPDFTANLGTSWQNFTTEFNTSGYFSGNVTDPRFQFWIAPFAVAGDIYYIDNVRLEKLPPPNPTVKGNAPTGTNVPITAKISVNFSTAMDQGSVNSSFSTIPATTGSFSWIGNTMIYTPSNLAYNTTYNVIIGIGSKDMTGKMILSAYTWSFNHRERTTSYGHRTTPNGITEPVTTRLNVTFSKAMNKSSAESAFWTIPATTGSFSWSGNMMIYTPATNLNYGTKYNAWISTGAKIWQVITCHRFSAGHSLPNP